jgi:cellulose synthase/poly-beta-1,6-N-acetylglucosamine synthase-like glycosyltransferase
VTEAAVIESVGARGLGLWKRRVSGDIRLRDRITISVLTGAGAAAVLRLADWWFRADHVGEPMLFALLSLAFWYGISRIVLGWVNYTAVSKPAHQSASSGLRVAVFTTSSPGEPVAMFEQVLAACQRIRYPHTTYLLDDTRDVRYRQVARHHGAVCLELVDIPGAKAGKINRALEMTDEDFILVLDPDHIPFPEFLDRVLGYFRDERVGFVQVSQAYYNQARSFTAKGAAEQTYAFYGPGLMGLYGHGANVAIGANCTFRRSALASIGGHGVGLAEDLITAIRLHAAGWRSVYAPEIISRGLVPEELGSLYKQQLKWSRGVYEVLFSEMPRLFWTLTWRQRLSYFTIGTYYLFGVTTPLYLVFPYLYLWTGLQPANMRFSEFLIAIGPVAAIGMVIYLFMQRWLCDPATERGLHWRGLVLKWACWPVVFTGTVLAILRAEVPYVPTAKQPRAGTFVQLAWPQFLLFFLFGATLIRIVNQRLTLTPEAGIELTSEATWGMVAFAVLPVLAAAGGLYAAWESRRPAPGAAWDHVDVSRIGDLP